MTYSYFPYPYPTTGKPYVTNPIPTVNYPPAYPTTTYPFDSTLSKVRAICEALTAKAITKAEARKALASVDPAFEKILTP